MGGRHCYSLVYIQAHSSADVSNLQKPIVWGPNLVALGRTAPPKGLCGVKVWFNQVSVSKKYGSIKKNMIDHDLSGRAKWPYMEHPPFHFLDKPRFQRTCEATGSRLYWAFTSSFPHVWCPLPAHRRLPRSSVLGWPSGGTLAFGIASNNINACCL